MSFLSSFPSFLGVDIGSTSIKIVELKKVGDQVNLLNYGFTESSAPEKFDWLNNPPFAAKIINQIINDAGMKSQNAISALPTFSVFSSVLNLSNVPKKDIPSAVHWEAKKVIPIPLEEMILDWKIIDNEDPQSQDLKILLTGAPRALVKKYIEIFKQAKLTLASLETETFSLVRSLVGNDKSAIMLVEIGANTTDVSIIDKSIPMLSRSIDIGGLAITDAISSHLNMSRERAEQFKYDLGVSQMDSQESIIPKTIIETFAPVVNEIKYAINLYLSKNNRKTEKVILSGGSALLPNLSNYLSDALDIKVIIGDPWSRVVCPPDLRPLLNEIGPRMSVALGLAMREAE
jgi:type IV pilus assembly protein PilM